MALTAQNIVDAVSVDMRSVLGSSGADATIILEWVDRIHKDALHSSLFSFLNEGFETVTTTAGTSKYTLTASPRRILTVYDRRFDRPLLPFDNIAAPLTLADQASRSTGAPAEEGVRRKETLSSKTFSLWPEYFKLVGTQDLHVFPAPATTNYAGTAALEVFFEKQVITLTALTDTLVIPEDGKDMMVAGVNYLTAGYLKRVEDAGLWLAIYEKLKRGDLVV